MLGGINISLVKTRYRTHFDLHTSYIEFSGFCFLIYGFAVFLAIGVYGDCVNKSLGEAIYASEPSTSAISRYDSDTPIPEERTWAASVQD
jgi:hypothetical protein